MSLASTVYKDAEALIKGLELPYLEQLQSVLQTEIQTRKKSAIRDAAVEIHRIAASVGISVDKLAKMKLTAPQTTTEAKYANPDNTKDNWSGRGRKPFWLVDKLKEPGTKLEDFAIKS